MWTLVLQLILWTDPTAPLTSDYQEREARRGEFQTHEQCMRELHRWHAIADWRDVGIVVRDIPEAEGDARWEVSFAECRPSSALVG